ncbi:uncharacterized protein LOC100514340 [Sus scrofa]|uniref:Uncharacterized LOC100514340 n=2 Tax=Sus scrofa TaxID=9823 RepID=A0A8D0U6S9_PIG|nr:uncharacterized protein LOC100514340 [Sus scrofa]
MPEAQSSQLGGSDPSNLPRTGQPTSPGHRSHTWTRPQERQGHWRMGATPATLALVEREPEAAAEASQHFPAEGRGSPWTKGHLLKTPGDGDGDTGHPLGAAPPMVDSQHQVGFRQVRL